MILNLTIWNPETTEILWNLETTEIQTIWRSDFKWSEFSYGHSQTVGIGKLNVSGFQMVKKGGSPNGPVSNNVNSLKIGQLIRPVFVSFQLLNVRFLDPHCRSSHLKTWTFEKLTFCPNFNRIWMIHLVKWPFGYRTLCPIFRSAFGYPTKSPVTEWSLWSIDV